MHDERDRQIVAWRDEISAGWFFLRDKSMIFLARSFSNQCGTLWWLLLEIRSNEIRGERENAASSILRHLASLSFQGDWIVFCDSTARVWWCTCWVTQKERLMTDPIQDRGIYHSFSEWIFTRLNVETVATMKPEFEAFYLQIFFKHRIAREKIYFSSRTIPFTTNLKTQAFSLQRPSKEKLDAQFRFCHFIELCVRRPKIQVFVVISKFQ